MGTRSASLHLSFFWHYYSQLILNPNQVFQSLVLDDHKLTYAFISLSIPAFLYTLVYIFLTIGNGAPRSFPPWLSISLDNWYFYNQFFLSPSLFACWILSAGVAQLLAKLFNGKGSFEDNLAVFGFAISVSSLFSLMHDLPDTFLGAIGLLDLREYEILLTSPTIWRAILWTFYSGYILLFLILFPLGIRASQRVSLPAAVFIGVTSYAVYQGFFLIFNR